MNHDELAFLAEVSSVNQALAVYIGRMLDVDGGRTEYSDSLAEVERGLATRLLALGQALEGPTPSRLGRSPAARGRPRPSDLPTDA